MAHFTILQVLATVVQSKHSSLYAHFGNVARILKKTKCVNDTFSFLARTNQPTNQPSNSMQLQPSWEVNSYATSQKIPHILWNPRM